MSPDIFERMRRRAPKWGGIEQRALVVQRIFQDDLITELSAVDDKLIREYYGSGIGSGIKAMPTERAFRIGNVKPCSPGVRDRLDRAVGRYIRMNAQRITAEEWLKRAPFDVKSNRRAMLKALDTINKPPPLSAPGPGRRAILAPQVEQDIRTKLETGELTIDELRNMKLEALGDKFGCGKNTASKVKKSILGNLNSRK